MNQFSGVVPVLSSHRFPISDRGFVFREVVPGIRGYAGKNTHRQLGIKADCGTRCPLSRFMSMKIGLS